MFDPWLGKFYMPCGVAKKRPKTYRKGPTIPSKSYVLFHVVQLTFRSQQLFMVEAAELPGPGLNAVGTPPPQGQETPEERKILTSAEILHSSVSSSVKYGTPTWL